MINRIGGRGITSRNKTRINLSLLPQTDTEKNLKLQDFFFNEKILKKE